jgi:phosphoribosyl 1,2-cyclic phosphodiesterase
MIIRCWGARGSIPVSGEEYLRYGGDTTCIEIRSSRDEILIFDAGTGIRRLGRKLYEEGRLDFSLLFTHTHWDHVMGLPFFRPVFSSRATIDLHGCAFLYDDLPGRLNKLMSPPFFPLAYGELPAQMEYMEACRESYQVRGLKITPAPLSHPNNGQGYRIEEQGRSMVFLTDNELTYPHEGGLDFQGYVEFARGADLLIHDAEFTRREYEDFSRGWGHSHWESALDLAVEAGVRRFGIYHHNQNRTDPEVDEIVENCRRAAAERGADLECFAVAQDAEYTL